MSTKDLQTLAYETLKEHIITCKFRPGSFLNEQSISSELKISRTPIREALILIEKEGLVKILPKKGIFVTEITTASMSQLFQARLLLEPSLIRAAAPHLEKEKLEELLALCQSQTEDAKGLLLIDTDFKLHNYLTACCNNSYIAALMRRLLEHNSRIHYSTNQALRIDNAREEHIALLEHLLAERYEEAERVMRLHLENCRDCSFSYFLYWNANGGL